MDMKSVARALRAFGDPTRLRILALLARHPASVGKLSWVLRRRQPVISRHLTYLGSRGFVESKQVGPYVVYNLSRPAGDLPRQMLATLLRAVEPMDEIGSDRTRAEQPEARP